MVKFWIYFGWRLSVVWWLWWCFIMFMMGGVSWISFFLMLLWIFGMIMWWWLNLYLKRGVISVFMWDIIVGFCLRKRGLWCWNWLVCFVLWVYLIKFLRSFISIKRLGWMRLWFCLCLICVLKWLNGLEVSLFLWLKGFKCVWFGFFVRMFFYLYLFLVV